MHLCMLHPDDLIIFKHFTLPGLNNTEIKDFYSKFAFSFGICREPKHAANQ